MSTTIIIIICILLLIAYVFDISSGLTKVPSVILLLVLGWIVRKIIDFLEINVPDLNPLLPALGTIGLILIVLEGALELEVKKSKMLLVIKSFSVSLIPLIILASLLAWAFQSFYPVSFKNALINAIPFCVISSAIAIASVKNISGANKEFVTYESSLSDIFGILFFNFILFNDVITARSFGNFSLQILIIIIISFLSVLGLSYLLSRIKHHVTFTPIILLVILIYMVSKVFHLPGLIFILIFSLFLGNLENIKQFGWLEKFHPEKLEKEIIKFKEITIESTFLIRSLFFLLFGYLMQAEDLLNLYTLPWAVVIVLTTLLIRWFVLEIFSLEISPLLFISPKGLITVLLFISIPPAKILPVVNNSLVIQTIVLSVLIMMFGLMAGRKPDKHTDKNEIPV